ncbi:hypothetical protein QLQ12_27690 [Actinoplanes sp. NEAU-A12]|uniref:Uncharacterized protein n=1 Tax=Actinoplanes sandaracinus TaxID=3045177 RepID=A0ABT6WRN8_9ACTN|nr:hypothetical protein [Actinoplanes sandaracinus]MDI6102407.1 hypothetical protein [Actinoplanes sandaracinus]
MAEQRFGNFTFNGGQQSFGDHNTLNQTNNYYGDQRDEIVARLAEIRRTAPDPAAVEPQIVVIERALQEPTAESVGTVRRALDELNQKLGTVQSAAEAVAAVGAIGAIVAANWPF